MKEEKGITIVALILTVIVLIILAGVSISSGTKSLDETRLKGFYTNLEIIQKRVDDIAATNESYMDTEGNQVYIKEQGVKYVDFTDTQKTLLQNILNSENINVEKENFKYFTIQELEDILDLSEIAYNVFIDFDNRIVIAENGITIEDKTYHVLENATYFVEQDTTKNTGIIESLIYETPTQYGENKYKVNIKTSNPIGDLKKDEGYVKYKKVTTKYWITSSNTEIILELDAQYNIIYVDSNNNSLEKRIKLILDTNNQPTVTEITE